MSAEGSPRVLTDRSKSGGWTRSTAEEQLERLNKLEEVRTPQIRRKIIEDIQNEEKTRDASPAGASVTLYQDAKIRRERQKLVMDAADLDAELTSNVSKVSARSKRITLERTEKELEAALSASESSPGAISILGLARVLRAFGVFRAEAGMGQVARERSQP